jgi:hypothetical protein
LYYEYSEDTLFEHALDLGLVNQKTSKNVENTTQEQISRKTLNELAQQEGAIIINNPKRCKFSFI